MGFVLSVLYLAIYYFTPAYLLGPLADAHIEVIVAVLAMGASLPALMKSSLMKAPQSLAMLGLAIAIFLSRLIGSHYLHGGVYSLLDFIPNGMAFFLVYLHFNSKRRLQVLILLLFSVCLVNITHGIIDLRHGVAESGPAPPPEEGKDLQPGSTASPYLLKQINDSGQATYRLEGLGEINDPNDFGQLIVCLIPMMFIFWHPTKLITNIPFVILPVCALLTGVFLTHSRGALVALTVVSIVAARRRIGTVSALLMAGCMFLAAMALHFTGGRNISAAAGEDRTDLWGQGMDLLRSHPLFGVGYKHVWEFTQNYLTVHNSVIVCAAELGMFGLFFWSLFLFSTIRDAVVMASPLKVSAAEPVVEEQAPFPQSARTIEQIDQEEINRLGRLMVLSLTGFLVSGWFLSRSFVVTLFLLGGMVEAIYEFALRRGMIVPRMRFVRVLPYSGGLAISLVVVMYIMIRILNLVH